MQAFADLLVEIGTEELPPKALAELSSALCQGLGQRLVDQGLSFAQVESFATPRRLACLVHQLVACQPDQRIVRRGPPLSAAFDSDRRPTKAAVGFARSCNLDVDALEHEETEKGTFLIARWNQKGVPTETVLSGIIGQSIAALPAPKRMRWANLNESFVRPVHWACVVFGTEPIPFHVFGITAGNRTYGHRFHHPEAITLRHAADYPRLLREKAFVEPDFARRRSAIAEQVRVLAESVGGEPISTPELLDEVTALCEWPRAILCQFDVHYLDIPHEVLIETMQTNQKYFAVQNGKGSLLPYFVSVANIESRDPDRIRVGNERVIRPRFADAAFFFEQDSKRPLESFASGLEQIVFQDRLGSIAEKSRRVARLAVHIGAEMGFEVDHIERAAHLAKCDLLTKMVFEFPRLQGLMGRRYAENAGEAPCVASAIEEQYLPRHAGDRLPETTCGLALSLADRLVTLVAIFAVGQRPTGDKDPYALRRSAIGVVRLMIEGRIPLDLQGLLAVAAADFPEDVDAAATAPDVLAYILDRLYGYYQEQGMASDCVDAVLHVGPTSLSDIDRRVRAVAAFKERSDAAALIGLYKRLQNIVRKAEPAGSPSLASKPDTGLFVEAAERKLQERTASVVSLIQPLKERREYLAILIALGELSLPIDDYFNAVRVMVDDQAVQTNRLRQLSSIRSIFSDVADISRLQI